MHVSGIYVYVCIYVYIYIYITDDLIIIFRQKVCKEFSFKVCHIENGSVQSHWKRLCSVTLKTALSWRMTPTRYSHSVSTQCMYVPFSLHRITLLYMCICVPFLSVHSTQLSLYTLSLYTSLFYTISLPESVLSSTTRSIHTLCMRNGLSLSLHAHYIPTWMHFIFPHARTLSCYLSALHFSFCTTPHHPLPTCSKLTSRSCEKSWSELLNCTLTCSAWMCVSATM